jgi:hypothetical protein
MIKFRKPVAGENRGWDSRNHYALDERKLYRDKQANVANARAGYWDASLTEVVAPR